MPAGSAAISAVADIGDIDLGVGDRLPGVRVDATVVTVARRLRRVRLARLHALRRDDDRRLGAGRLDQPSIQPSKPRPLTNTTLASASVFASPGVGDRHARRRSAPTRVATSTRSPPTLLHESARIEKVATALSLRLCLARPTPARTSQQQQRRRRQQQSIRSHAMHWRPMPARLTLRDGVRERAWRRPGRRRGPNNDRERVEHAGDEDDGRARRHARHGTTAAARHSRRQRPLADRDEHHAVMSRAQKRAVDGRQHHDADREQRAERVEAADEIDHHQRQKRDVRRAAGAADRAQEARIDAFEHQRPVDQRQHDEAIGRDAQRSAAGSDRRAPAPCRTGRAGDRRWCP